MTKGERTRLEIIQKAAPIFNQKGFEGASLSDLMRVTGLQKGGIYSHFSGKQELARAAFDYSWERAVRGRQEGVAEVENTVDRLKHMIHNFIELRSELVPGGCPLMNTAVDSDDGNAILRARAKKALQSWSARLSNIASEGVRKKQIDPGVHPRKLAQLIIASLEGALLLSRLEKTDQPLDNMRQHLEDHLEKNVRSKNSRALRRRAA